MTERYEEYHFYKDLKICVRCHKNAAEPHKVLCLECSDADHERYKRSKERNHDKIKARDNNKYKKLREQGICTYCKHEKAAPGKTKCSKCLAKVRNKRNAKKSDIERTERVAYGICYICGKDKCMKDKGVCQKCYQTRLDSIQKIMHLPGTEYWKNDNKLIFRKKQK